MLSSFLSSTSLRSHYGNFKQLQSLQQHYTKQLHNSEHKLSLVQHIQNYIITRREVNQIKQLNEKIGANLIEVRMREIVSNVQQSVTKWKEVVRQWRQKYLICNISNSNNNTNISNNTYTKYTQNNLTQPINHSIQSQRHLCDQLLGLITSFQQLQSPNQQYLQTIKSQLYAYLINQMNNMAIQKDSIIYVCKVLKLPKKRKDSNSKSSNNGVRGSNVSDNSNPTHTTHNQQQQPLTQQQRQCIHRVVYELNHDYCVSTIVRNLKLLLQNINSKVTSTTPLTSQSYNSYLSPLLQQMITNMTKATKYIFIAYGQAHNVAQPQWMYQYQQDIIGCQIKWVQNILLVREDRGNNRREDRCGEGDTIPYTHTPTPISPHIHNNLLIYCLQYFLQQYLIPNVILRTTTDLPTLLNDHSLAYNNFHQISLLQNRLNISFNKIVSNYHKNKSHYRSNSTVSHNRGISIVNRVLEGLFVRHIQTVGTNNLQDSNRNNGLIKKNSNNHIVNMLNLPSISFSISNGTTNNGPPTIFPLLQSIISYQQQCFTESIFDEFSSINYTKVDLKNIEAYDILLNFELLFSQMLNKYKSVGLQSINMECLNQNVSIINSHINGNHINGNHINSTQINSTQINSTSNTKNQSQPQIAMTNNSVNKQIHMNIIRCIIYKFYQQQLLRFIGFLKTSYQRCLKNKKLNRIDLLKAFRRIQTKFSMSFGSFINISPTLEIQIHRDLYQYFKTATEELWVKQLTVYHQQLIQMLTERDHAVWSGRIEGVIVENSSSSVDGIAVTDHYNNPIILPPNIQASTPQNQSNISLIRNNIIPGLDSYQTLPTYSHHYLAYSTLLKDLQQLTPININASIMISNASSQKSKAHPTNSNTRYDTKILSIILNVAKSTQFSIDGLKWFISVIKPYLLIGCQLDIAQLVIYMLSQYVQQDVGGSGNHHTNRKSWIEQAKSKLTPSQRQLLSEIIVKG